MLITIAGAVLAGFGIAESFGEIALYAAGGGGAAERFASIADKAYRPGDSIWSKDLFVADCLELPQTMLVRVQPVQRHDDFAEHCRAVARATVADMPTYSAAWLAVAVASAQLDDLPQMQSALDQSARTGPDLAWLAERRSAIYLAHQAELGDAEASIYRTDLDTLMRSRAGADLLATRYTSDMAQRDSITEAVATASTRMQQRFVNRVRSLSTERGNQ